MRAQRRERARAGASARSRMQRRQRGLRAERKGLDPVAADQRRGVELRVEAGAVGGDVVGDDQVGALAEQLLRGRARRDRRSRPRTRQAPACALPPRAAPSSARMSGVRTSVSSQRARRSSRSSRRRRRLGRVVGDGRRHDHDVRVARRAAARPPCISPALRTRTSSTPAGGGSARRSGDQHDARAAPRRLRGHRVSHLAARSVADVAHGVDDPRRSGPAVTSTSRPSSEPVRLQRSDRRPRRSSSGSASRPLPIQPQAR